MKTYGGSGGKIPSFLSSTPDRGEWSDLALWLSERRARSTPSSVGYKFVWGSGANMEAM